MFNEALKHLLKTVKLINMLSKVIVHSVLNCAANLCNYKLKNINLNKQPLTEKINRLTSPSIRSKKGFCCICPRNFRKTK